VQAVAAEITRLLDQAGATDDCLTPLYNALGQTHLFAGEPARALPSIRAGLAAYDRRRHLDLASRYGEDPFVVCHQYASLVHCLLGNTDQCVRHLEAGLEFAQELRHPFSLAQMHWMAMLIGQLYADASAVRRHARALIPLCRRQRIAFWLASGRVLNGWALARRGRIAAGLASIGRGLVACEAMGFALIRPYHLTLLAEVLARSGQLKEAFDAIGEALATVQRTGEHWYEGELRRRHAELVAAEGLDPFESDREGLPLGLADQPAAAAGRSGTACNARTRTIFDIAEAGIEQPGVADADP